MKYELIIVVVVCLIVGFSIGIFTKKKNDLVSSLAEFIIFGKQQNASDELINQTIKNLNDLMLEGYNDFQKDEKAAYAHLKRGQEDLKHNKALIKAMQKTIDKATKVVQEFS